MLSKHGALLYDGVAEKLTAHLQGTVATLQTGVWSSFGSHGQGVGRISNYHDHDSRHFLMYMDRTYILCAQKTIRIRTWFALVSHGPCGNIPKIGPAVTQLVLQAIDCERNGDLTDNQNAGQGRLYTMLQWMGQADRFANVYRDFLNKSF